jgi:hypothetical protein
MGAHNLRRQPAPEGLGRRLQDAIQPGSPLENILAIYDEAGSIMKDIGESVLGLEDGENDVNKVNLAKLF